MLDNWLEVRWSNSRVALKQGLFLLKILSFGETRFIFPFRKKKVIIGPLQIARWNLLRFRLEQKILIWLKPRGKSLGKIPEPEDYPSIKFKTFYQGFLYISYHVSIYGLFIILSCLNLSEKIFKNLLEDKLETWNTTAY